MTWHAVEGVEDALVATRRLLLPFSLRRWLVLAVAVFFVSGSSTVPAVNIGPFGASGSVSTGVSAQNAFGVAGVTAGGVPMTPPGGLELAVALAVVGTVLVLAAVVAYVSSVMEFVFVEITSRQEVRVRGFFGESLGRGLSLFAFRLIVGLVVAATVALLIVFTVFTGGVFLIILVLMSPAFILFAIALWLVMRFTVDFVVPVMLSEDIGIVDGWRVFSSELRAEWKQYGIYAIVRFLLGILSTFVVGVGVLTLVLLLGIPFGIVALVGFLVGQVLGASILSFVLVAVVAVLFVLTLVVAVVTFVQVPVQTYLRYYSLFVLGSVSPEYDLVGDIRESVKTDGASSE